MKYQRLKNLVILVTAVAYFAATFLGQQMKLRILCGKLLIISQRLFGTPPFRFYALADGIRRILSHAPSANPKPRQPATGVDPRLGGLKILGKVLLPGYTQFLACGRPPSARRRPTGGVACLPLNVWFFLSKNGFPPGEENASIAFFLARRALDLPPVCSMLRLLGPPRSALPTASRYGSAPTANLESSPISRLLSEKCGGV